MSTIIINLNETTKEFLEKSLFADIPEEAHYVVINKETGEGTFIEEFKPGFLVPKMVIVTYYEADAVQIN